MFTGLIFLCLAGIVMDYLWASNILYIMNRFDRITAILIQLQSKKIVRAQDIADRFHISLRTVYRDVKSLEEAGVPIIGEAGYGYSIMEGYRLPPVQFTKEEATAFLMAEKILEKFTDHKSSEVFKSALYKIKSVLRSAEKTYLEDVDSSILIFKTITSAPQESPSSLPSILTAISEKKVLRLTYKKYDAEDASTRELEPVGIFLQNNLWYLIAYCRMRKGYRNFRVDRFVSLTITDDSFVKLHPSLADYLDSITNTYELHQVVIWVDKNMAKYLGYQKFQHGFVGEKKLPDHIEMTFMVGCNHRFLQWYLSFAKYASIIAPTSTKDLFKTLVKDIAATI